MQAHLADILQAVLATYKSKALMGTQDQVGLLFFGTVRGVFSVFYLYFVRVDS